MRESRLGRWLVGGVLAAAAAAFVSTVPAQAGQAWEALPVSGLESSAEADEAVTDPVAAADEAAADEAREESVTPASWEWS
jgi:hypothetical protein